MKRNPRKQSKRELSVPEKHMLKIARATLRMPDAMVGVMGGPSKAEAKRIVQDLTRKGNPMTRKRNFTLGLPRNKWVNAQVMVTSGGKIRAKVSESVLGHAGIGGSASLNPSWRRTVKGTKKRRRAGGLVPWDFPSRQKQVWKYKTKKPMRKRKRR